MALDRERPSGGTERNNADREAPGGSPREGRDSGAGSSGPKKESSPKGSGRSGTERPGGGRGGSVTDTVNKIQAKNKPNPEEDKKKKDAKLAADAKNKPQDKRKLQRKIEDYGGEQKKEVGKIQKELTKGADDISKQTEEFQKQNTQSQKDLAGAYKDISTNYQDIAKRYRDEISAASKDMTSMKKQAQVDFMQQQALGAKAIQSGMGGGPQTGAQQAMMMSQSGAAASDAYGAAMNRISSIEEQRRQMGFNIAQSATGQQMQGAGVQMQGIQAGQQIGAQSYQAGLGATEARTNAATYGPSAQMEINTQQLNTEMQRKLGVAQVNAANNYPGAPQAGLGSMIRGGLQGAAGGAMIGTALGGPGIGTAVGAGLGVLSTLWS